MASKFPAEIVKDAQDAHAAFFPKGPFVCISLGQWALESAFGTAEPPGSDNDFGIKAVAGQDFVVSMTHETLHGKYVKIPQHFAKYKTHREGFMAHAKLLATSPLYAKAQQAKTPEAYADALQGIYATGIPGHPYGAALVSIIDAFDLKQFDPKPAPPVLPPLPKPIPRPKKRGALKQLVVIFLEAILQTLEDDGTAPALLTAAIDTGVLKNRPKSKGVFLMSDATAQVSAAAPSVSAPVAIDWGDFADQILTHAGPIVDSVAPGMVAEALQLIPAGSILSVFITPKVVTQYVDQGMKTLEGVFAGKTLNIAHAGALETFVVNAFNNFEPKLAGFLGDKLGPLVKAEVAKVLPAAPPAPVADLAPAPVSDPAPADPAPAVAAA